MVHGVRLRDGRAEWYRNRWVRSRGVSRALGEAKAPGPRHNVLDAVNTHVVGHAGLTLALVEAGCAPAELSLELDTLRYTDFDGTLPGGFSAHPKYDPATCELHAIAYKPFRRHVQYVVLGPGARVRKVVPVPVPATPIMHDMALTQNYVILFDMPARFSSPLRVLRGAVYNWDPDYPARFGVLPRNGTGADVRWFSIDPCFILHTVNAYEYGSRIVLEGMRYERVMDETLQVADRPKSAGGRSYGTPLANAFADADGFVAAYTFTDSGVSFRGDLVRTPVRRREQAAGRLIGATFSTLADRRLPTRLFTGLRGMVASFAPGILPPQAGWETVKDSPNHVPCVIGDRLLLLGGAGAPFALDPRTLAPLGRDDFGGALPKRQLYLVGESHLDPGSGERCFLEICTFPTGVRLWSVGPHGTGRGSRLIKLPHVIRP